MWTINWEEDGRPCVRFYQLMQEAAVQAVCYCHTKHVPIDIRDTHDVHYATVTL